MAWGLVKNKSLSGQERKYTINKDKKEYGGHLLSTATPHKNKRQKNGTGKQLSDNNNVCVEVQVVRNQ